MLLFRPQHRPFHFLPETAFGLIRPVSLQGLKHPMAVFTRNNWTQKMIDNRIFRTKWEFLRCFTNPINHQSFETSEHGCNSNANWIDLTIFSRETWFLHVLTGKIWGWLLQPATTVLSMVKTNIANIFTAPPWFNGSWSFNDVHLPRPGIMMYSRFLIHPIQFYIYIRVSEHTVSPKFDVYHHAPYSGFAPFSCTKPKYHTAGYLTFYSTFYPHSITLIPTEPAIGRSSLRRGRRVSWLANNWIG